MDSRAKTCTAPRQGYHARALGKVGQPFKADSGVRASGWKARPTTSLVGVLLMRVAHLAWLVVVLLAAAPARAAQDPEDDDETPLPMIPCTVSMLVDNQGSVTVFHIMVAVPKPARMPLADLEKKVAELLGRPLRDVHRHKTKTTMNLDARADNVFTADAWKVHGTLDFAPIAELLNRLGVASIQVSISRMWTPYGRSLAQEPVTRTHTVLTANPQPVSFSFL